MQPAPLLVKGYMQLHLNWIVQFLIVFLFHLENVTKHLQIQSSEVQDGHKAIVDDLADVRHQAQDIYQKIGA